MESSASYTLVIIAAYTPGHPLRTVDPRRATLTGCAELAKLGHVTRGADFPDHELAVSGTRHPGGGLFPLRTPKGRDPIQLQDLLAYSQDRLLAQAAGPLERSIPTAAALRRAESEGPRMVNVMTRTFSIYCECFYPGAEAATCMRRCGPRLPER
jgi:hypothetical protein